MRRSTAERFVRDRLTAFVRDESGATAIEYGLIITTISVVVILAVTSTGQSLWNTMNKINNAITAHS